MPFSTTIDQLLMILWILFNFSLSFFFTWISYFYFTWEQFENLQCILYRAHLLSNKFIALEKLSLLKCGALRCGCWSAVLPYLIILRQIFEVWSRLSCHFLVMFGDTQSFFPFPLGPSKSRLFLCEVFTIIFFSCNFSIFTVTAFHVKCCRQGWFV